MAGRPPKYKTPIELQEAIDDYFQEGGTSRKFVVGSGKDKHEIEIEVFTITGLALWLGFASRQSFYDYGENKEFSYTIKKAHLRIEQMYEENLQYGNTTGSIFALKNLGWIDTIDNRHSGDLNLNVTPLEFFKTNKDK